MIRVLQYLNQFFAGIGAEDAADHPVEFRPGVVGIGRVLADALGDDGEVVGAIVCGDNYFHEEHDAAVAAVDALLAEHGPDLVVAGPAFNAGRYGMACGEVCTMAAGRGAAAVTGMFPDNPAVGLHRRHVYIVQTAERPVDAPRAMREMARIGRVLAAGGELGSPADEGYISRGQRVLTRAGVSGAERAVELLLGRIRGEGPESELPLPEFGETAAAELAVPLAEAKLALVTTGGVYPDGNPDGLPEYNASTWAAYPVAMVTANEVKAVHGGFNPTFVDEDPDRVVPVDALARLAEEGVIGSLHGEFFSTTGVGTPVVNAQAIADSMAETFTIQGIDAIVLTGT